MDLNRVYRWEERNTLTGRIFENNDSLMRWTDGSLVHLQQSVDITDSVRLYEEANRDDLTGLLNRRAGKVALVGALERLGESDGPLIVGLFDVNKLKAINDAYGHKEGDRALRLIAQEVRRTLRSPDFCFRLSGDEFVVVFHQSGRYEAEWRRCGTSSACRIRWGSASAASRWGRGMT